MPKERLHMLLAEESLGFLGSSRDHYVNDEGYGFSCLLGSILPDVLFYDLPSFAHPASGARLHRLEGENILPLARFWLDHDEKSHDRDFRAWLIGLTSHFLADGAFHPAITKFSAGPSPPARGCVCLLENAIIGMRANWKPTGSTFSGLRTGIWAFYDAFERKPGPTANTLAISESLWIESK